MPTRDIAVLIKDMEFISVATCDHRGRPNAAPKFLLKYEDGYIYLVDYTIGTTWKNLKVNPRISMSFMDPATLTGYQINGFVQIIDKGPLYEKLRKEMMDKAVRLTARHIVEHVRGTASHEALEVAIREKFIIFKVRAKEVVVIGHKGELLRDDL